MGANYSDRNNIAFFYKREVQITPPYGRGDDCREGTVREAFVSSIPRYSKWREGALQQ